MRQILYQIPALIKHGVFANAGWLSPEMITIFASLAISAAFFDPHSRNDRTGSESKFPKCKNTRHSGCRSSYVIGQKSSNCSWWEMRTTESNRIDFICLYNAPRFTPDVGIR